MRPVVELAAEPLSDIRGLIFDVDDTVTRHGRLEPEAFTAMHALVDHGFTLISITGRPLGWSDVIARHWPVACAVGENGAGYGRVDYRGKFARGYAQSEEEREDARAVLDAIQAEVARALPHVAVADDQVARRCDLAFDVAEHTTVPADEVDALVAIIERHGARSAVSSVHAHAIPGTWDKASGARLAVETALSITFDPDEWVFIGDSGNDSAAFELFARSVGVSNVRDRLDRVTSPPRFVTEADRGRGFAELARLLLRS